MSYFDDYVADGLCCEFCGGFMDGSEPGFVRRCSGCEDPTPAQRKQRRLKRNRPTTTPPITGNEGEGS